MTLLEEKFVVSFSKTFSFNFPWLIVNALTFILLESKLPLTFLLGMLGFKVHEGSKTMNGIPSVQPFQGWALLLPPDSPFREERCR